MAFSGQEYWSGLPYHPSGDLADPGIDPGLLCLLHWQAGSLPLASSGKLWMSTQTQIQSLQVFNSFQSQRVQSKHLQRWGLCMFVWSVGGGGGGLGERGSLEAHFKPDHPHEAI